MIEDPSGDEKRKAVELYAVARKLEAQGDYDGAVSHYEQSLRLHENETVREAYARLLATIGPL